MKHRFLSLEHLKLQWPELAPFYTQSWVYAGISAYFSKQNKFDQLTFDNVSETFLIHDHVGKAESYNKNYKYHGQVFEGHPCDFYDLENIEPDSVLISGHEHLTIARNYTSVGFDYCDILLYNEYRSPVFFYELNRLSVKDAAYDVMIAMGSHWKHRITFMKLLSERRNDLTIVTDDNQTFLDTDLRFSSLGLEVYLNKVGAETYKYHEFYPSFYDTNGQRSLDHMPHKKMFGIARVNVVLETTNYTIDCPYCTEKTFKALAQHSAFVVYGDTGILSKLKKQGFMTFGDYCDESYDQEKDPEKRMLLVIEALKQLCESCKLHPQAIDDICQHNQNLFFNQQRHTDNLAKFGERFMSIISGA